MKRDRHGRAKILTTMKLSCCLVKGYRPTAIAPYLDSHSTPPAALTKPAPNFWLMPTTTEEGFALK